LGYPDIPYINGHATGTDLLEVPTIYKAYFSGIREYPFFKIWPGKWCVYVPPFSDPEDLPYIPIWLWINTY